MSEKKAVALKYPEGVEAPFIVAKGTGKKAEAILSIAEKNDVPVEMNTSVVDLLGLQDVGTFVPREAWEVLAQIFSVILKEN